MYCNFKQLNSNYEERRISIMLESNLEPSVYAVGVLSTATFFEQRPVTCVIDTLIVVDNGISIKIQEITIG